jgi:type VI secretion system protein ImpA
LLDKYWEPIHPVLDPDDDYDPTARVNILEELSNFESVLRPLSLTSLVDSKSAGRFCLRDIQIATGKIDLPEDSHKPELSLIQAAFMDVADETVQVSYEAITDSIRFVHELENLVGDKVGIQNGPDLSGLTAVLKEMRYAFDQYAPTGLADSVESDDEETQSDDSNQIIATPKQSVVGGIGSRQDVLKTLDLICKYYAENEPSSPVPILLQRAKKLVTADFMQIVQNLLPDGLSQLEQIKGPDPDADQY